MKEMAASYGVDISKPAKNAKEAVQAVYMGYLAGTKENNGAATSLDVLLHSLIFILNEILKME